MAPGTAQCLQISLFMAIFRMGPQGVESVPGLAKQPKEKMPLSLHVQGALSIK